MKALVHSILALIYSLLTVFPLQAQQLPLRQLTTTDGLPSNTVYQVFQDSRKFIWLATDAGLARYDGDRFAYFSTKNGLNSNEVIRLAEDSRGRIWIFHFNGTFNYYYNGKIFNASDAPWLDELTVGYHYKNMYEDGEQRLYFYNNVGGDVHVVDKNNHVSHFTFPAFYVDHFDMESPDIGSIISMIAQDEKGYYLYTSGGVFYSETLPGDYIAVNDELATQRAFRLVNKHFIIYSAHLRRKIYQLLLYESNRLIDSIAFHFKNELIVDANVDREGNYWVSSFSSGVYCIKDDEIIVRLPISKAQNILEDHEGNIWIASLSEGLFQLSSHWNKYLIYATDAFSGRGLRALSIRKEGGIWAHDGQQLFLLKDNKIYPSVYRDSTASIDQLEELANGKLLLGQSNASLKLVGDILLKNGKLWMGRTEQDKELVKRFSVNRQRDVISTFYPFKLITMPMEGLFEQAMHYPIFSERVFYTYFNQQDQLMVNGRKVYRFTGHSLEEAESLQAFSGKIIRQQLNLPDGSELFNIGGDSLFLLKNGQLYNLSLYFDYNLNQIITHLAYGDDVLFIASPNHVYMIEHPLLALKGNLLKTEPLVQEFSNIRQMLYHDQALYVAGSDGLTVIPRASLRQTASRPIPHFAQVLINNTLQAPMATSAQLQGQNKLHFVMGTIHYSPSRVQYAYQLEGSDKGWTVGENYNVVYQDLSPGNYIFRFRVKLPTSEWSETLSYNITIKPSLLQHPLFYVLMAAVFIGLLYLWFIRKRNERIKTLETEHQMLVLEQKALHSMMNPHFIFNALGSIQSYILKNNPSDAGLYLSQFARLIRQNLNAIKTSMIPLEEETDRLRNYLNLERLRMSNRFGFVLDISDEIEEEALIPTMILQPIVENAIWHGLSARENDGLIKITFTKKDEKSLLIVVEDNGVGMEQSARQQRSKDSHLQIGMSLTIKRLELIGKKLKVPTGIVAATAQGAEPYPGTRVEIVVPFVMEEGAL